MSEQEISNKLIKIHGVISEDDYPQVLSTIEANVNFEEEYLYEEAFEIAIQLMQSDETKQLHPLVAEVVKSIFEDEIKNNNAEAANNLGILYYNGRIGEQNFKKAVELYTTAAKGGSRVAAENLGYCYYYGRDVKKDYEKAFHYFALGAFDGHLISLYKIGDMYKNGYYVEKNEKEAFFIYEQCVNTMTDEALHICGADIYMRMGDCYYQGVGTDINLTTAMNFFQRAEALFRERIESGDFLIRNSYKHCVEVQTEIREKIESEFPKFEWTKF